MAAVLLLLVGHLIRKYDLLSRAYSLNGWIWTLLIAVCVANILLNERISMVGAFMGFNAVGLFCCVVETVGIICFCHRFHLSFKWIGQNTLYILSAHLISMPIVGIIIVRTFTHLSISSPYAFFFASLTLNITLALALAWLMKRFNLLRFPGVANSRTICHFFPNTSATTRQPHPSFLSKWHTNRFGTHYDNMSAASPKNKAKPANQE